MASFAVKFNGNVLSSETMNNADGAPQTKADKQDKCDFLHKQQPSGNKPSNMKNKSMIPAPNDVN